VNLGEIGSRLNGPSIRDLLGRLTADPRQAAPAGEVARAVPTTLPIAGAQFWSNSPAYAVHFSGQAIRQYLALVGRASQLHMVEALEVVVESTTQTSRLLNDGSTVGRTDGRPGEAANGTRGASTTAIDYGTLNAIAQSAGQMSSLTSGRFSTQRNARSTGKRWADSDDATDDFGEYAEFVEADQSPASQSAATALRAIRTRSLPRKNGYPRSPL
jgi:hypothetical protein